MHSAELHGLYTLSNIIAVIKSRMIRNAKDASYIASYMAEKKNARRILVREPQAKRPLETPRRPWTNTKIDLRRTGWSGVGRINLAQNGDKCRAHVNTLKNVGAPLNVGKISIP
jgi:hypothetical protein